MGGGGGLCRFYFYGREDFPDNYCTEALFCARLCPFCALVRYFLRTLRAQRWKNFKIALRDWNFQSRLKISSEPPTKPLFFLWGNSEGQDWNFQSRLKISREIEIFNRDWNLFNLWALRALAFALCSVARICALLRSSAYHRVLNDGAWEFQTFGTVFPGNESRAGTTRTICQEPELSKSWHIFTISQCGHAWRFSLWVVFEMVFEIVFEIAGAKLWRSACEKLLGDWTGLNIFGDPAVFFTFVSLFVLELRTFWGNFVLQGCHPNVFWRFSTCPLSAGPFCSPQRLSALRLRLQEFSGTTRLGATRPETLREKWHSESAEGASLIKEVAPHQINSWVLGAQGILILIRTKKKTLHYSYVTAIPWNSF